LNELIGIFIRVGEPSIRRRKSRESIMKLRLDVDYPYPSRIKSFLFIALNRKAGKDYLKNAKIIARMINETPRKIQAYWFFTTRTEPDDEILQLLHSNIHEIGLHVANDPNWELKRLEQVTGRKIRFYTIHGTARMVARMIWRRKIWEAQAQIPQNFRLQSLHDVTTLGLDVICYSTPPLVALKVAEASIARGDILHVHPEWLFKRGKLNHRGPFYETLREILQVDQEMAALSIRKKGFARIAKHIDAQEYEHDFVPTEKFLRKLGDKGIDIFTFIERKWCNTISDPSPSWAKTNDNVALLQITSYDGWWKNIGKKTRNMIRKAEKSGVTTQVILPSEELATGIWKIYNETPIRQERAFPHYGTSLESVKRDVFSPGESTFIGAFFQNDLVGFIQLVYGDNIVIISQILSLQKFWDKAANNALLAKTVEFCANRQVQWVMYGRMGNHPSLDKFKESNSFKKFPLTRYYIPLTRKGQIAIKLGLHKEAKDVLPQRLKYWLIPAYNWASRRRAPKAFGSP
jgi:hypothetical protein